MQHLTDETRWALISRLAHAHEHHGRFKSYTHGLRAIDDEIGEVWIAIQRETPQRVYEELLDVATVAIRYAEQMKREGVV